VSGTVTFTPSADFVGTAGFDYTVSDGSETDAGHVTVTVTAVVNVAPVITGQTALSTAEDTGLTITLSDLTVTDPDNTYPDDFTLAVQTGTNYTVSGSTITPALNFNGDLSVPVRVNDGINDSNTYNLTVTVTAVNDAPVAVDDTSTTAEDTALDLTQTDLKGDDTDVDNANAELKRGPQ